VYGTGGDELKQDGRDFALPVLAAKRIQQAIEAYRSITVTPEFFEAERLRSKARHDEAQARLDEGK
jgi:hypothetical protein